MNSALAGEEIGSSQKGQVSFSSSVCRTCLLQKDDLDMEDIYNVSNILKDIVPIQFEKRLDWPSKICSDCIVQVNQAFEFRVMCIESDKILKERIILPKQENEDILNNTDTNDSVFNSDSQSRVCVKEEFFMENYTNIEFGNFDTNNFDPQFQLYIKEEIASDDDDTVDESRNETKTKKYECLFCEKRFRNKKILHIHKRKHFEDRICPICKKHLQTVSQFQTHIYLHKGRRTYLCKTCGKSFKHAGHLKRHEEFHAGVKPHKCTECDKSYTQLSNLRKHAKENHTTEKSYMCNICPKEFFTKYGLRSHIKDQHLTSPGERPYVCVCGESFKNNRMLDQHRRVAHNVGIKYVCTWCNKGFKYRHSLRRHEKVHKEDTK